MWAKLRKYKRWILPGVLLLQAILLLARLDLLSLWGDELFTLETVAKPVGQMLDVLRGDVHPPLYYLLVKGWIQLPLPWDLPERIRAFSALCVLATTAMLDVFWLRRIKTYKRMLVLALWTVSPAVILYGRMGRSYSMQAAVVVLALYLVWRLRLMPGWGAMAAAAGGTLLTLYTHYLPGVAIVSACTAVLLVEAVRDGRWRSFGLWMGSLAIVAAGYAPWILTLGNSIVKWGEASGISARYAVSPDPWMSQLVKAGYTFVALAFGECLPVWAAPLCVLVVPLLVVMLARLPRRGDAFTWLLLVSAAVGYVGAARWVSYPFIAARLLWVLPFFWLWMATNTDVARWRRWALYLLLFADDASLLSYYRVDNFLNKGYASPLREMAASVHGGMVIADTYNTDFRTFAWYVGKAAEVRFADAATAGRIREEAQAQQTVWVLRNTHDISPGKLVTQLEAAVCAGRRVSRHEYLPYAAWQKEVMRVMGIAEPPAYFLELTECSRQ
jgi:hypothetical protein